MLILDEYQNGTFRLSQKLRNIAASRTGSAVRGTVPVIGGSEPKWTFYLESGVSRYLPLQGPFDLIRFSERQNYRSYPTLAIVSVRDTPVRMMAYRVGSMRSDQALPDPEFARRFAAHDPSVTPPADLMLALALSAEDQDVLSKVRTELTGGSALGAADFGRSAAAWLGSRHTYTLGPRIPAGPGDPLIRWMTSREAGHCELFAGSFVVLARAAGFPARVVTGFRGGSWNGYSNNFTVRNSDAHAWCEIFDATTQSWLRVDPTPGVAGASQDGNLGELTPGQRSDRSWNARLESLRILWYRRIVSFDQQSQIETFKAVKEATQDSGRRLREFFDRVGVDVKRWIATPWSGDRAWTVFAGISSFGVLVWLLWLARRRRWDFGKKQRASQIDAIRREAGRWLMQLQPKREEIASDNDATLISELERLRYGSKQTWPEPTSVFRRARIARREMRRAPRVKP
jgi:transglutaminase-like putative cysteine protease